VKLARLRRPKTTYFLSFVEYRPNTNISDIIYTKKYMQSMYLKVGRVKETKGGETEDNEY
jgi:hypothetical protein